MEMGAGRNATLPLTFQTDPSLWEGSLFLTCQWGETPSTRWEEGGGGGVCHSQPCLPAFQSQRGEGRGVEVGMLSQRAAS